MISRFVHLAVDFLRRDDGPTAVEYAIILNVLVVLSAAGISVSGDLPRQAYTKARGGVANVYQSARHSVRALTQPDRAAPGEVHGAMR